MMRPDYEKIIQAVNFFALKRKERRISKLYFLKMIFLADRYHLRMYGRLITNDHYVAMEYGPVASETKKIFEFLEIPSQMREYAAKYLRPCDDKWVVSSAPVDKDVFSSTDLEALEEAWKTYWRLERQYRSIVNFTHLFPEWKKHEELLRSINVADMNVLDFFSSAPTEAEYCPASPERVALNRKHFVEMSPLM